VKNTILGFSIEVCKSVVTIKYTGKWNMYNYTAILKRHMFKVNEILEKQRSTTPPNPPLTVYKIPTPSRQVGRADFEPTENEQLGITSYFEIFAKFFMETLNESIHMTNSQLFWLFNALLCQVVDHLNMKSYVQLALDGHPLGVLLVEAPSPGEKINTNEPLEILFHKKDYWYIIEHVMPLEIQSTATRYYRTNVKISDRIRWSIQVGKTTVHHIRVKSLQSQIAFLQQNHLAGNQLDFRHSVWYNFKEIFACFMFYHGIDQLIFSMFGQFITSSKRNLWHFETKTDQVRSVSFAVNHLKAQTDVVLLNLVFPLEASTVVNQVAQDVTRSLLPNREDLRRAGLTDVTHIISIFVGNVIPAIEYSHPFDTFDLHRSKRLDANKFQMKFFIASRPEQIRQILNLADESSPSIQTVNRIPRNSLGDRSKELLRLRTIERLLKLRFNHEAASLTNDQILALKDGLASRTYHVRYLVRRVLAMFPVTGYGSKEKGFWTAVEDVRSGTENANNVLERKVKTEDRIRRAVESLDGNVPKSAEIKDLLKKYSIILDFNHIDMKTAGQYGEIKDDQKTEMCQIAYL